MDDWGAPEWSAFGNVMLAVSAAIAGFWTLYNFQRSRKIETAKWLKQIFVEFYIDENFEKIRSSLEYNYTDFLQPLIEKRFFDRDLPLTDSETETLKQLDQFLNYFEHLLYLENKGMLGEPDRKAIFEYWFDILAEPEKASLRTYLAHFGFEGVANILKATDKHHMALYGSLLRSEKDFKELGLENKLKFISNCELEGEIYDLGEYPGLILKSGIVQAELYEIIDPEAIKTLDQFEKFFAGNIKKSLYIRQCVHLLKPNIDAWVYVYNMDSDQKKLNKEKLISSGSWKKYTKRKEK